MKGLPFGGEQNAAFAAHRFADQETFRPRHRERGGMELDVLGIQDARPGARGHRQPVAARARRVGGVAVNATDPAGGQDGDRRQRAVDRFSLAVKDIGAVAGDRFVGCQRVTRVMGIGDQVHGGGLGQQFHVGAFPQGGDQPSHDGPAGPVPHVQDAPPRSVRLPVQTRDHHPFRGRRRCPPCRSGPPAAGRSFLGQDARCLGQECTCAGGEDVFHQQVGAVIQPAADDAALGIA